MSQENKGKLNKLLRSWPKDVVYTTTWLTKNGIRFDLVDRYRRSNWVYSIGRGAVARSGDKVNWIGGLYAIQNQLEKKIHTGGKTALQLQGLDHFISLGEGNVIFLFGLPTEKLPGWFKNYKWNSKICFITTNLFSSKTNFGLTDKVFGDYSVQISSPERAILEVCYLVPNSQSFEELSMLMEGLNTLRPDLVQPLLECCNSFKVKRLFMYLAEKNNHPWLTRIDKSKIDFGKGKRVIVKGGKFDSKYQISVPEEFTGEI